MFGGPKAGKLLQNQPSFVKITICRKRMLVLPAPRTLQERQKERTDGEYGEMLKDERWERGNTKEESRLGKDEQRE